jgi:hypothetical protein
MKNHNFSVIADASKVAGIAQLSRHSEATPSRFEAERANLAVFPQKNGA